MTAGPDALDHVRSRLRSTGSAIYLGEGSRGWVTPGPERAALVLGPPRTGKTTAIVVPTVLAAPGAVVATSTKVDVMETTVPARRRVGRCWLFDPSGSVPPPTGVERLRWSPVASSREWDAAVAVTHQLVAVSAAGRGVAGASHWSERAEALLAPLLHAAALEGFGIATVLRWVQRREVLAPMTALERHGATMAGDALAGVSVTEERELSGIFSTAAGVLAAYRSASAVAAGEAGGPGGEASFDADALAASGDTVYVCAPATAQELLAPVVAGFLEAVRAATYRARAATPVLLALDEMANIAPLPSLPAIVSEGGSQGLVTLACLQDLSQARSRWGAAADGFLSLFSATVVLPGLADLRTLNFVSALAGEVDTPVRSLSRIALSARRPNITTSTQRRPRLPVDAVARGRPGHGLLMGGASPPAWIRLTPWYASPLWSGAVGALARR